jgi:23S rRNA (cytidine1920-2'-O)/16S rRNA (cytidine1409-2'-O)-methyltransferase
VVALVKPQFEAGRKYVEKGGVVKAPETHLQVLQDVMSWIMEQGLVLRGVSASPIRGPKGNIEFFIWVAGEGESIPGTELEQEVSRVHG